MSAKHTVSQVARMAHVSVRTLHHYDEIGLLKPSGRTANGYRLYGEEDLARLHQILLFRQLGFSLEAIRRLLDDPTFEQRDALLSQRALLVEQTRKTEAIIRAVDKAIEALEGGRAMSRDEMFDGFEEFDHARYEAEAKERWGHTDAYEESARRTKRYKKEDWARIKAEGEAIVEQLAKLLERSVGPEENEAMELAEAHRRHIDRWFYPCSRMMHTGLADLYMADARFQDYFERRREGLTEFVVAAIRANAARP